MNDLTVPTPELLTPRLRIYLPPPSQAAAVLEYRLRNRDHFRHNSPPVPDNYYTTDYWCSRLGTNAIEACNQVSFRFFLAPRTSDLSPTPIIGDCSLANIVRGAFQAAHLGYNLDRSHTGRGLMTEALGSVLKFAFESLRLHRVMANHLPDNSASARVLDRLGFAREGIAKDYIFLDGAWRDHILTSRVNPYPQAPQIGTSRDGHAPRQ